MTKRGGFTLVELTIAVAVLAVLSMLVAIGLTKMMADSRDHQRESNATALTEALENYYQQNGEYPAIPAMVSDRGANAQAVATLLHIDKSALTMPQSDDELSIVSTASPKATQDDVLVYDAASTANSNACTNTSNGGCARFVVRYKKEDLHTVELASRHDSE